MKKFTLINPLSQVVFFHPIPLIGRGDTEGGLYQRPFLISVIKKSIDLKLCMHTANLVIINNQ